MRLRFSLKLLLMGLPFALVSLSHPLLANPLEPDLTITKQHSGSFSAGGIGLYTITVTNIGTAPSSGGITVTDTLPSGLSVNSGNTGLVAISGSNAANWTCNSNGATPQAITCQSNAVITQITSTNSSVIQFYVNLSTTTSSSITNVATVSGGGESNANNNSASDPTTVTPVPSFSCGVLYGVFGPSLNSLRVYDPTTSPASVGNEITALTGYSVALGIAPFLDTNGRRRFYYLNAVVTPNTLYYYDGVQHVNTNVTVPDAPNRMGFNIDGMLYMSARVGSNQVLYRYDPSTGIVSGPVTITNNPNNAFNIGNANATGDIAFDLSGVMYLVTGDSNTANFELFRIDGATTSTPVATLIDTAPTNSPTTSLGFTPDGQLYLISNGGRNWQWNLVTGVTTELSQLGSQNGGFDLASCFYPNLLPKITASKTVAKVAGSAGVAVLTGDTLEYSIIVRNTGSSISAGTTLQDNIPAGATYVTNSTKLNGAAVPDTSGVMPFVASKPINGPGQVAGSLVVDTTPAITTDNEATIKFRVTINANSPSTISNRATVVYAGAPNGGISTDDPNTPGNDPTITPIANRMPANVLFVKRITAINGSSLNVYKDDTTSLHAMDDNNIYWPTPLNTNAALGDTTISTFLRGAIDSGNVKPGDTVEYTVYILNAGNFAADSVKLCDRITGAQKFTGTTIQLQQNNAVPTVLTSAAGDDRATFYASSANSAITNCNFKGVPAADNGALVVDVTGTTGTPNWATLAGSSVPATSNSYGFVRFATQIDP